MAFLPFYESIIIVGVVKSLATDGGKVITSCSSVLNKWRFCLFTSPSLLKSYKKSINRAYRPEEKHMSTEEIFSPFQIKDFSFRNRLGVAPMTRMSAGPESIPRQDVFDFLVRRAENGATVVFTEAIVTDYESSQGYPGQARMTNQPQVDAWKPVVKEIQKHGAIAIMQMFHCGRMAWPEVNPAARSIAPSPVAPSQDNPLTQAPYPVPEEMCAYPQF